MIRVIIEMTMSDPPLFKVWREIEEGTVRIKGMTREGDEEEVFRLAKSFFKVQYLPTIPK